MTNSSGPLAQAYREFRRTQSSSAIYDAPQAPARPDLYKGSPVYGGLASYSREVADPLAQRPDESGEGHQRRIAPHLKAAAQAEADAQAQAAWDAHRNLTDNRQGSRGILGNGTAQDRATALGNRGFGSGRQLAQHGGLETSIGPAPARVFLSQIQQDGPVVRPAIPNGSSGAGWVGVDHGRRAA